MLLKDIETVSEIQIHNFYDAFEAEYDAVSFLRFLYKSGGHAISFAMSKSKVAPTMAITLPQLELNSAVVSCRLFCLLIAELDLPVDETCFWTDVNLSCSRPDQWGHVRHYYSRCHRS